MDLVFAMPQIIALRGLQLYTNHAMMIPVKSKTLLKFVTYVICVNTFTFRQFLLQTHDSLSL